MPDKLPTRIRSPLLARLRTGEAVQAVAEDLGVPVREVFRAARTDTRLPLALAGVDPDSAETVGIIGRADYIRLLALGASPSLASQILFDGAGQANTWRSEQPAFAAACDTVTAATVQRAERRPSRFTPERRRLFLEHLRAGMATTKAAAEVGITSATVYQRRRRDPDFAAAMDRATATRSTPEPADAATDAQWTASYQHLAAHGVLRQAALAAGIRPETVYDRRRSDPDFAKLTDHLRLQDEPAP
ncbi:hypothetical protein [Streptomyces sp. A1547]|uniref:hypothetical protein n=1 Tax=Streptomyces sp. A1547 TaxID=2563105 RepID=UPI00109E6FB7|nr:hypothetical protein [Streptomyces sp. A1547]THA28108.1 hypothetical protein E6W17_41410 [Streptomyces sp. A1547]